MPSKYITGELIVQKAAEEVRNGVFSSFREAERVRNVSRKKIKRAFENLSSRNHPPAHEYAAQFYARTSPR